MPAFAVSYLLLRKPLQKEVTIQLKGSQGWIEDDDPTEISKEKPNPHTV